MNDFHKVLAIVILGVLAVTITLSVGDYYVPGNPKIEEANARVANYQRCMDFAVADPTACRRILDWNLTASSTTP